AAGSPLSLPDALPILPVCPLARDGYWPCVSGMLRRGRLRSHDLPLASWGEGLPSRRTSHLLGTCPTRHAVDTTALHGRPRPDLPHGPPEPGVTVDDGQHRPPQTARDEVVEAAPPRRERLASAQLQGEQVFSPVGEDADDAQHRHADHLSGT